MPTNGNCCPRSEKCHNQTRARGALISPTPWGLDIWADKKVLNIEWDDRKDITELVTLKRGDWEQTVLSWAAEENTADDESWRRASDAPSHSTARNPAGESEIAIAASRLGPELGRSR